MSSDLNWLSAIELADLVGKREVSATELIAATFSRIEETEGTLHAFINLDRDGAVARAAELDKELTGGATPGPLCGVPFSVKDQIWAKGLPTTGGSLQLKSHMAPQDSACVARLRAAGGIMVGKSSTPEYGLSWRTHNRLVGETTNPWDTTRTPGGSSGGATASVAAGITPIAIGGDGAGSIRLPAAFCGVVGLLTSLGRVPRYGVFDGGFHTNGIGPIARTVADITLAYQLMSGPDGHDPTCIRQAPGDVLSGIDVGIDDLSFVWWNSAAAPDSRDETVIAASRAAAALLAGGTIADGAPRLDLEQFREVITIISNTDRYARVGQQKNAYDDALQRSLLGPEVRRRFKEGSQVTGAEFTRAMSLRAQALSRMNDALDKHSLILAPVAPHVAPLIPVEKGEVLMPEISTFTYMANLTGLPAISVPCGMVDGLPVGLQIIGRFGDEATVLRAARALERLAPWAGQRPPL